MRFPTDVFVLLLGAEIAQERCDWRQAGLRAADLRANCPASAAGWRIGIEALRRTDCDDEADALAEQGIAALPEDLGFAVQEAERSGADAEWAAAEQRAALVPERFPREPAGCAIGVRALREAGGLERARALVTDGMELSRPDASLCAASAEVAVDSRN